MDTTRDPAQPDAAALAAFAPPSMVRPGHAFSLAPLSVCPPPAAPQKQGMPARFLTQLSRYIPVDYGDDAAPLSTPGVDARARPAFTSPPTASPAGPPAKRRRPAGADAAPALPARASSHPLLATWHPLLAPSVAWPSAPMPPRVLVLDMVSDAADAALAYVDQFAPHEPSGRWVAPASPGDAEGAEAMLALLRGDGGGSGEEQSDGDADADSEEEEEEEEEEEGPLQPRFAVDAALHQCSACGTRNSPMWRKHPSWGTPLCNACGLRVMRGRPPLPPGGEAQPPPRRLFPQARTPRAQPGKRGNGDRVFLGRAKDDSAGDGDGAATPGELTPRRQARGWKPNPKFYGVDSD